VSSCVEVFSVRFLEEWLPKYCGPRLGRTPDGFRRETLSRLTEHDAYWFLRALEDGVVVEADGFFRAPRSGAREQLISTGSKTASPRPLTLWLEPIVTVGALGRLHGEFGWPADRMGMQTDSYAFDFVCYDQTGASVEIAGEVKNSRADIDALLRLVSAFGREASLEIEPPSTRPQEHNAYKKVLGLRRDWPDLFWTIGPGGDGTLNRVVRAPDSEIFELHPVDETALRRSMS
jgi:hypothetical protein